MTRFVDVLVVGGGPAGLSAATELRRLGVDSVEVVEREAAAGGVPRHCFHPGYGLRDLRRSLSGPAYARELVSRATRSGVVVTTGSMVTGWVDGEHSTVTVTGSGGVEAIEARAVVLATGARERPRAARLIPGTRPAGVWTTGQLQQAVHLHDAKVGLRAVVVGSELVAHSAVMTLRHSGCEVVAMVTEADRIETYSAVGYAARARYRFPMHTSTTVAAILGTPRVTGVDLRAADGQSITVSCDTVVFTGDWIPDYELVRLADLPAVRATGSPLVDCGGYTGSRGIFAAGNLVHPVETADRCALAGRDVAVAVVDHLAGVRRSDGVSVAVDDPLTYVAPGIVVPDTRPAGGVFSLRSSRSMAHPTILVRQGSRVLERRRLLTGLVPGRPIHLPGRWVEDVDATGPEIRISVQ